MNKQSVITAYNAYLLAVEAKQHKKSRYPEEKDVLDILRELTDVFGRDVLSAEEIAFVCQCLFLENLVNYDRVISRILQNAAYYGKVVETEQGWKLL